MKPSGIRSHTNTWRFLKELRISVSVSGCASSLVSAFRVSLAPMLSQAGQRSVIALLLFDAVLPQLRVGGIAFLRNQGSLDEQGLSFVTVGVLNHLGR